MIVGASVAGAKAAETLRAEGFDGRVVLVGAEAERPYERPPLSKDYLRGEAGRTRSTSTTRASTPSTTSSCARTHARSAWTRRAASWRSTTASGCATTACCSPQAPQPRRLEVPGAELDGVHYLRTVEDSDALRERLDARRAGWSSIGAGWIGAEVAASARQRGLDVTMLDPGRGAARARAGRRGRHRVPRHPHRPWHGAAAWASGSRRSRATAAVERVRHERRARARVRLVVVGVGVEPRTELGGGCRAEPRERRSRSTSGCETSVPGIFAAGDVANAYHPFYGERIRVEHWANALNQGPAAARNMLGRGRPLRPPAVLLLRPVRRRHGVLGLRVAPGIAVVFRGDPASREFIAFWLVDGPRRRRDERERVGRDRAHPGSDPRSCAGR